MMKTFKVILEHPALGGGHSAFTTHFVKAETKEEAGKIAENSFMRVCWVKKVVRAYKFKDGEYAIDQRYNDSYLVKKS